MSKGLSKHKPESVSICLCGQAGQGIQTVEHLLTRIFKLAGFNVFATKEYMSRVRGGMNSTSIRISSGPVRAAVRTIDILVPLNKGALQHVEQNISDRTIILADKEMIGEDIDQTKHKFVDVPFTGTAAEIGDKIYSNVVAFIPTSLPSGLWPAFSESNCRWRANTSKSFSLPSLQT